MSLRERAGTPREADRVERGPETVAVDLFAGKGAR